MDSSRGDRGQLLNKEDIEWLRKTQPGLKVGRDEISGRVEFIATYDATGGLFRVVDDEAHGSKGTTLKVSFDVRICEREKKIHSNLPSLYVTEVEAIQDRHFNQLDQTACLCSPLEEEEFLLPSFLFRPFFEKLVMPFLYGQAFYSREHHWPWDEYAHGATGLLESYVNTRDALGVEAFLKKLKQDDIAWPKIRATLLQKSDIKGHASCFCKKGNEAGNKIRRCHPDALKGLLQLKRGIKKEDIIP